MSNNGTLLPIPAGSVVEVVVDDLIESYESEPWRWAYRSWWLRSVEDALRIFYPTSTSADRKLTARHVAPFPLALGPNVV